MYAGKGESVALPTTGHLHILKTGYVYWENDGKWDNAKKQTVDGRVSIGRLDPFESVGLNQDDSKPALKKHSLSRKVSVMFSNVLTKPGSLWFCQTLI